MVLNCLNLVSGLDLVSDLGLGELFGLVGT